MRRSKLVLSLFGLATFAGVSASALADNGSGDCDKRDHHRAQPYEVVAEHAAEWSVPAEVVATLTKQLSATGQELDQLHKASRAVQTHTERFTLHQEIGEARNEMMTEIQAALTPEQFELLLENMHPRNHGKRRR